MSTQSKAPAPVETNPEATIPNVLWELTCIENVMHLIVDDEGSDVPSHLVLWLAAQIGRVQELLDEAEIIRTAEAQS